MSLASEVNNPAIDNLVESSLVESENNYLRLEWISCEEITDIKPTPTDAIYYANRKLPYGELKGTMLLLLGSSEECTPTLENTHFRV